MRNAGFLLVWWIGATAALLLALELSATALLWVNGSLRAHDPHSPNPMTTARSRIRVVPRPGISAPGLHTDADGWRVRNPGETLFTGYSAGDYNVVVLGGSTTWGAGVADADTFPAQLQGLLASARSRDGRKLRVFNAGIPGYALRREAYLLVDFLREGRRIDLAIFYDGINEDCADRDAGALQPPAGVAYDDPDYLMFRALVAMANDQPRLLAHNLAVMRVLRGIWRRLGPEEPSSVLLPQVKREAEICAAAYLEDARFVRRLAGAWGIEVAFVLQPGGAFISNAGTYKFPHFGSFSQPAMEYFRTLYERILAGANDAGLDILDWSELLESPVQRGEAIFVDSDHLTSRGNEIVARKFRDLLAEGGRIRER